MTTGLSSIIHEYQGVAANNVVHAVAQASKATGANFSFLMKKAAVESGFDPDAKAKTSSATGLFQFIESTWLSMIKKHGEKYGLSQYADCIDIHNGKACVTDGAMKEEILALRKNPEISALMAGEFSAENKDYLERNTSAKAGDTELYLAHFMGAGGAARFINARDENPHAAAADLFPKEARANKSIFFDTKTGSARTLDDVYRLLSGKLNSGNGQILPSRPSDIRTVQAPSASAPSLRTYAAEALSSFGLFGYFDTPPMPKLSSSSMMLLLEMQMQVPSMTGGAGYGI